MNHLYTKFFLGMGALTLSGAAFSDASPWLPVPRTLEISVSQVVQESTEFYRGEDRRNLPFGNFDQSTTWLGVKYGLTHKLALDFQAGSSNLDAGALGESRDTTDMSFGLTRSILDEAEHGTPSLSIRVGAIIAGDYTVGRPNSIGDGADAFEVTLALGRVVSPRFALAADLGMRYSSDDVPRETFANLGMHFQASDRLGLYSQYQIKLSDGDLDIAGAGFTPAGFPETTEEYSRIRVGAGFALTPEVRLDLSYYDTLDGRNTADFDAVNLTISYTLDLFTM